MYATSRAVIGWPSDHFSPGWILNVHELWSGASVHESAMPGTALKSLAPYSTSVGYSIWNTSYAAEVMPVNGFDESMS